MRDLADIAEKVQWVAIEMFAEQRCKHFMSEIPEDLCNGQGRQCKFWHNHVENAMLEYDYYHSWCKAYGIEPLWEKP